MMNADRVIPGWFQEIVRNHLIWLLRKNDVRVVLEVGAFLGKSTVFFAARVQVVYSVDYWHTDCLASDGEKRLAEELGLPKEFKAIWQDNLNQAGKQFNNYITRQIYSFEPWSGGTGSRMARNLKYPGGGDVRQDITRVMDDAPDLVFIDGDHSYTAVLKDLKTYGCLAKRIICGDDYLAADGVTQAVNETYGDRVKTAGPFWWVEVGNPE